MDRHLPLRPGLGLTGQRGANGPAWSLGAAQRPVVPSLSTVLGGQGGKPLFVAGGPKLQTPLEAVGSSQRVRAHWRLC